MMKMAGVGGKIQRNGSSLGGKTKKMAEDWEEKQQTK
jgi:hypothetical protein